MGVFDSWVLGQYDTCTFYTPDGRQAFGVCCIDPPQNTESKPDAPVEDDENVVVANKDTSINQWPPPFITHPPNHAAPTHPPISGNMQTLKIQYLSFLFK